MLSDPQSMTINAVAKSLPRVVAGVNTGGFSMDDGTLKLNISHTYGKRTRRMVRVDFSKIAADPLVSAQNIKYSMSTYLVFDTPITGFTVAEAKQVIDGFLAYMSASSGAVITKVLGGES